MAVNDRIRKIIAKVSEEAEVKMENGIVMSPLHHFHLFVVIPYHAAVGDFIKRAKGISLRKVQEEFPELEKYNGEGVFGKEIL